ncbi:MAG TPA: dihydroorotase [Candidatus Paceibacterota bacterium]
MKISDHEILMRKGDDFHTHLRTGPLLEKVVRFTAQQFQRALIMPNTLPNPIVVGQAAQVYAADIKAVVADQHIPGGKDFQPLMTIKLLESTTPEMIKEAHRCGVIAAKAYPRGVTTNSEDGIADFKKMYGVFEVMQKVGMALCLHGQVPEAFILDRETLFLQVLDEIVGNFRELRIVLEHVSTSAAVNHVRLLPERVAATITAHHLVLTLDDIIGKKGLNPHAFCQPIAQRPKDRDAVLAAAISGNPKFFFGSDSAPHLKEKKECGCGAAGVFSAPVLLPFLVSLFNSYGRLERLEPFLSEFGADFYRLPRNSEEITLIKEKWIVPENIDGIVPFLAGQELEWKVV